MFSVFIMKPMLILTLFPALIVASTTYNLTNAIFEELHGELPFRASLTQLHLNNTASEIEYRCFYKQKSEELIRLYHHNNQTNEASWSIQCGMAAFVIAAFTINIFISYKSLKRSTAILNQMKIIMAKSEPEKLASLFPNESC